MCSVVSNKLNSIDTWGRDKTNAKESCDMYHLMENINYLNIKNELELVIHICVVHLPYVHLLNDELNFN